MKVSVCIAAFRSLTLECAVRSICNQSWRNWELLVVGQGANRSLQLITENVAQDDSRVRYLHIDRVGACHARNAGMRAATGDIVAIIDDDCEAKPDWLSTIISCFEANPDVMLVGGAVVAPRKPQKLLATCPTVVPEEAIYDPVALRHRPPHGFNWIGCNVAFRRDLPSVVGWFDEWLGPGSRFPAAEDVDYMLRLEDHGVKMYSTPRAIVIHSFGYRYGFKEMYRIKRDYARGNGALAAKQVLMSDHRGKKWLSKEIKNSTWGVLRSGRFWHLPISILRLRHFMQAFNECIREYRVDPLLDTLYPVIRDRH